VAENVQSKSLAKYSVEDIDRGLCAVAYFNGSTRKASTALAEQGIKIPRSTLRNWLSIHEDRYEKLRADLLPRIHERVAEKHLELADAQIDASWEFLKQLMKEKDNIPPRDLSTALRNTDVGSAVHTDKALALRGQSPGAPVVNISLTEQVRGFAARGYKLYDSASGGKELSPEDVIEGIKAKQIKQGDSQESGPKD
jgi:hypothetical protein